jgi:hypothetical protein
MRFAAIFVLLLASACASGAKPGAVADARETDVQAVESKAAAIDGAAYAKQWIVVQNGDIAGAASLPDDAVRAAQKTAAAPAHRFVFRPADRGARLYRLAYVAQGGIVAGRKFLADLGLEWAGPPGKPGTVRRKGSLGGIDLAKSPRVEIEVASLDGSARVTLSAACDPDFDGGLLLPRATAARLSLERFEIPGLAEVQVALGRPFQAHRACVNARIAALGVSGPAEAVFETERLKR